MNINLGNKKLNISKTYLVLGIILVLSVILILIVGNKKNSNRYREGNCSSKCRRIFNL